MTGQGTSAGEGETFSRMELDFSLNFQFPEPRLGHEIWLDMCQGRPWPDRRDIDPVRFAPLLSHLSLIDVVYEGDVASSLALRLIGARLGEIYGHSRDRDLGEVIGPSLMQRWMDVALRILEKGAPTRATGIVLFKDKSHTGFEHFIAPLTNGGDRIEVMMVVDHYYSRVKAADPDLF
ncbi:MAG: PAS domain-containing protein [Rhizobiales bacterium]|nr:PAS domain-containing protein [Hyphomicrobiales bacterium]